MKKSPRSDPAYSTVMVVGWTAITGVVALAGTALSDYLYGGPSQGGPLKLAFAVVGAVLASAWVVWRTRSHQG